MFNQPKRVYADSSVYGGVFDEGFDLISHLFFEQVLEGRFVLVSSPVVANEIGRSPEQVRDWFDGFVQMVENLYIDDRALRLHDAYLRAGILSERWTDDAMHVALATVGRCDMMSGVDPIVKTPKVPSLR